MTGRPTDRFASPLTRPAFALARTSRAGAALFLTLVLFLAPRPAAAQARVGSPDVAEVLVRGQSAVDSTRILRMFDVAKGSAYDPRAVQAGLKTLWASGLFNDLAVHGRTADDGVHLQLDVAERPKVATIEYTGLSKFKAEDLSKHLGFQAGDAWRDVLLATGRDSIVAEYVTALGGERDAVMKIFAKLDLEGLVNYLSSSLPLTVVEKQSLLESATAEHRFHRLCDVLRYRVAEAKLGFDATRDTDS